MSRPLASPLCIKSLSLAAATVVLAAFSSPAEAGCGGRGGYFPAPIHRPNYKPVYRPIVSEPVIVHKPVVVTEPIIVPQPILPAPPAACVQPEHGYTWVQPGESLDVICLREYGDASVWPQVARFNGLTSTLPTDRPVQLPAIYPDGRLTPSTAPAPPRLLTTQPPVALPAASAATPPLAAPSA